MKRFWIAAGLLAALSGITFSPGLADEGKSDDQTTSRSHEQEEQADDSDDEQSSDKHEKSDNRESKDREHSSRDKQKRPQRDRQQNDDEVRMHYDADRNRLSIDVDDDVQFRNRTGRNRGWAHGQELDLRYDTDNNELTAEGEGTIDVDRAANAMARWWQSWWEEEKTARRSHEQGTQSGARVFLRQHDSNDDGYLSRREVPESRRSDFDRIDRDGDGYLSQNEIRRFGESMYQTAQRRSPSRRETAGSSRRDRDDQTWSQWWASWWSSEDEGDQSPNQIAASGAREFIRKHDQNGDGYLMRSEMPDRMYDDFDRLDTNGDRYLSRNEIQQHALREESRERSSASRPSERRR
jgi:Ca2+-binding EF-hand superfamily protein